MLASNGTRAGQLKLRQQASARPRQTNNAARRPPFSAATIVRFATIRSDSFCFHNNPIAPPPPPAAPSSVWAGGRLKKGTAGAQLAGRAHALKRSRALHPHQSSGSSASSGPCAPLDWSRCGPLALRANCGKCAKRRIIRPPVRPINHSAIAAAAAAATRWLANLLLARSLVRLQTVGRAIALAPL